MRPEASITSQSEEPKGIGEVAAVPSLEESSSLSFRRREELLSFRRAGEGLFLTVGGREEGAQKKEEKPQKPHGLKGRPRPPEVRQKISESNKGKPKTTPSWLKGRTGLAHPAYVDGQGATREYNHEKHTAWKVGVLRASNFACFVTGATNDLHCHHLLGWWNEATRYEISNGIAITSDVHKEFHNLYGRGQNMPLQFEEFCLKIYNITNFPWRQENHKPSFTIQEEAQIQKDFAEKKALEFAQTVKDRKHEIQSGEYKDNHSDLTLFCSRHNHTQLIQAGRYKKSKFGLNCCAREKQSISMSKAHASRREKGKENKE